MPFVSTVRGYSPEPHSLNEPKSLYQSPSGAYGSDLTHTAPHWCRREYNGIMPTRTKPPRAPKAKPVRQSVTIHAPLADEVRRVAKERQLTMSRALVALAERGVRAELDAKENLKAAYRRFMGEQEPARKNEAGKDLIRTIFGKDAIAEDTVL